MIYRNPLLPYQIIVLDHHPDSDQRIIRHINHCEKQKIPIHRIRFNLHHSVSDLNHTEFKKESCIDSPISLKRGLINYVLVYLSTLFCPFVWYRLCKEIFQHTNTNAYQIIFHIHDPFLLLYGIILKTFLFRSCFVIYDRHEYYEELRGIGKYCEKLARFNIDGVILVSSNQLNSTRSQFSEVKNSVVVPNYPQADYRFIEQIKRKIFTTLDTDRISLVYIGSLSTNVDRDIHGLLKIGSALLEKYPEVSITIGGSTLETDLLLRFGSLTKKYPGRFLYTGYLNRDDVIRYTCNAHLGFFLIDDKSPYWISCSPNKIFDYLMYGVVPVIRANIEEDTKLQHCSMIFNRNDTMETIISAIGYLIHDRNQLQGLMLEATTCSQFFSFESVENRYTDLYNQITRYS